MDSISMAYGRLGALSRHAQKNQQSCSDVFDGSPFFLLQWVYKKSAFLLAALDLGDNLTKHLPSTQVYATTVL